MSRFNPKVSEESVLQTCARIAKKGQMYQVNMYRYGEENKRKTCFDLKNKGKLKQGVTYGKLFSFYRPEDVGVINAAKEKHARGMRKIFKQNCYTMIEWARKEQKKTGHISQYYIKQFWEHKHNAWHYTDEGDFA